MTEPINKRLQFERLAAPEIDPWSATTVLSMIALEISWLVPWYHLVTGLQPGAALLRSYLTLGLTLGLAYALSKGLALLQLQPRARLLTLLGILFLNILGAMALLAPGTDLQAVPSLSNTIPIRLALPISASLLIAAVTVLMGWWRGLGIAQGSLRSGHAMRGFRFGLVMILLYGVIQSSLGGELRYFHFYIFLCAGLIAMISARLSSQHRLDGGLGPTDRAWIVGIAVLTVGLVGLAALAAAVARGPLSELASSAASIAFTWTARLLAVALSPVLYLAVRAMRGFVNLLNQAVMPQSAQEPQVRPSPYDEWLNELRETEPPVWADELTAWLQGILFAAAALAVVWLFLIRLRRIRALKPTEPSGVRGSSYERGEIRPALINALWDRLQALNARDRLRASERVRQIYAQLMQLCGQLGMARAASTTPLEYLPTLKDRFPEFQSELETITQAYNRVRYGELPETRREVDAVERAWARIRARGQELYYEGIGFFRT
jgi:hypothetical protein